MSLVPFRGSILSMGAFLVLVACEEGAMQSSSPPRTTEDGSVVLQEARTEVQEVERGDIFSTTEMALWDGRPSLGGVWVAHPEVTDPERVRITNTKTGQAINGALFRRERLNPGPRIQLSSEAAAALDILAGQPTELELIVLRQEEVVIEPAVLGPPPETDAAADEPDAPEATEASADGDTGDAVAAAAGGAAVAVAAASGAEAPKEKGFWGRFRDSLRNEPKEVTVISAPEPEPDVADTASVPDVETATLGAIAVATTALAEVDAEEASNAAAQVSAPATTSIRNPFIQVGLFGEQANASAAASSLRQAGIVPTVSEGQNANGPFWRVLVGPVGTANDQSDMLAQVRTLGYDDAFLTSN